MPFRDIVNYDIEELSIGSKKRIQQLVNDHGITEYIKEHRLSKVLEIDNITSCEYYDEDQFNRLTRNKDAHLNVFFIKYQITATTWS